MDGWIVLSRASQTIPVFSDSGVINWWIVFVKDGSDKIKKNLSFRRV